MYLHRGICFVLFQTLLGLHCAEAFSPKVTRPRQQRQPLEALRSALKNDNGSDGDGGNGNGNNTLIAVGEDISQRQYRQNLHQQHQQRRRSFLQNLVITTAGISSSTSILLPPAPSFAEEVQQGTSTTTTVGGEKFQRIKPKLNFAYEFIPPPTVITTSNKPLQTHLDEINLPTSTKGYTYGVTVDPIRITSLKEFGTPDEVAAKIVMAELRRDGVLDVTLASDASEDESSGAYDIEYISDGTRGKKHFVTRTIVKEGKLFVLTVQVKEDDWGPSPSLQREVMDAVRTFRVLDRGTY